MSSLLIPILALLLSLLEWHEWKKRQPKTARMIVKILQLTLLLGICAVSISAERGDTDEAEQMKTSLFELKQTLAAAEEANLRLQGQLTHASQEVDNANKRLADLLDHFLQLRTAVQVGNNQVAELALAAPIALSWQQHHPVPLNIRKGQTRTITFLQFNCDIEIALETSTPPGDGAKPMARIPGNNSEKPSVWVFGLWLLQEQPKKLKLSWDSPEVQNMLAGSKFSEAHRAGAVTLPLYASAMAPRDSPCAGKYFASDEENQPNSR